MTCFVHNAMTCFVQFVRTNEQYKRASTVVPTSLFTAQARDHGFEQQPQDDSVQEGASGRSHEDHRRYQPDRGMSPAPVYRSDPANF